MLNLMLHCGAHRADREEVMTAPTPSRTKTWVPIPHHRLLAHVESTLSGHGLRVVNQAHALWGGGRRYFGLMEVQNGKSHGDYGLVLGLRNSHDKSFPAGIALGSGVFICDNLAFSAEVVFTRRHTRFIRPRPVGQLFDRPPPAVQQCVCNQLPREAGPARRSTVFSNVRMCFYNTITFPTSLASEALSNHTATILTRGTSIDHNRYPAAIGGRTTAQKKSASTHPILHQEPASALLHIKLDPMTVRIPRQIQSHLRVRDTSTLLRHALCSSRHP